MDWTLDLDLDLGLDLELDNENDSNLKDVFNIISVNVTLVCDDCKKSYS